MKLWLWLICSWKHRKHRCYPETWGRGLKGPWHCDKCHPCGEIFDHLDDSDWMEKSKGHYVGKFLPLPPSEK